MAVEVNNIRNRMLFRCFWLACPLVSFNYFITFRPSKQIKLKKNKNVQLRHCALKMFTLTIEKSNKSTVVIFHSHLINQLVVLIEVIVNST